MSLRRGKHALKYPHWSWSGASALGVSDHRGSGGEC
jgi:hypothetical protein